MQWDGTLLLYCSNHPTWGSGTYGINIRDGLVFQQNGNLVLYNTNGEQVWSSNTQNTDAKVLRIEDSGLVLYDSTWNVIWMPTKNCHKRGNINKNVF